MTGSALGPDGIDAASQLEQGVATGAWLDLRSGDPKLNDPANPGTWAANRTVRAELLRNLLARQTQDPQYAVRLRGARIVGALNLEGVRIKCPLALIDCHFDEPVTLEEASARSVRFGGSFIPAVHARQLRTSGDLRLDSECTVARIVDLEGAHIGGDLACQRARFRNLDGPALKADGLVVDQSVMCSQGFEASGEVRFVGARVGCQLTLKGGKFHNKSGPAIMADGLDVGLDMFCSEEFEAAGEVRLIGAHIGGQLICHLGKFRNKGGRALSADGIVVEQDMFFDGGFEAEGEVSLMGAHIGGQFFVGKATFNGSSGQAISADRLVVDGGMILQAGIKAEGETRLLGAHVSGQLAVSGSFRNTSGPAVNAEGLVADHHVLFTSGFAADGSVRLAAADIGGSLSFVGVKLHSPQGVALDLAGVAVASALILKPAELLGSLDLRYAHVGVFDDDPVSWGAVSIIGFTYDALATPFSARQRCSWIAGSTTGYSPQPYEQLASALRSQGNDIDARRILIEKFRRRRYGLPWLRRFWDWFLDRSVLYGYSTWRVVGVLIVLWGAGVVAFHLAKVNGLLTPAQTQVGAQPDFHASLYSLDVVVPILSLHQFDGWVAHGWAEWLAICMRGVGWMLTTLAVLSLTGIFKRD